MNHLVAAVNGVVPRGKEHGDPLMYGMGGVQEVSCKEGGGKNGRAGYSQPHSVPCQRVQGKKD